MNAGVSEGGWGVCNCVIFVRVGSSLDGRAACLYVCVSFGARMCVIKVNGSVAAGYVSLSFPLSLCLVSLVRRRRMIFIMCGTTKGL